MFKYQVSTGLLSHILIILGNEVELWRLELIKYIWLRSTMEGSDIKLVWSCYHSFWSSWQMSLSCESYNSSQVDLIEICSEIMTIVLLARMTIFASLTSSDLSRERGKDNVMKTVNVYHYLWCLIAIEKFGKLVHVG